MLVKNGVIEKMFIEPDKEGDPFEVSDADTMLKYINPAAPAAEHLAHLLAWALQNKMTLAQMLEMP